MAISKAQQKATNKYVKNNYDALRILVPIGQKSTVQSAAESEGISLNKLTERALLAYLGLEEWPKEEGDK